MKSPSPLPERSIPPLPDHPDLFEDMDRFHEAADKAWDAEKDRKTEKSINPSLTTP